MRYLFGPVSAAFAEQNLKPLRSSGACLAFGPEADMDVVVTDDLGWPEIQARFPAGWRPDALVLHLPYAVVPAGIWSAELPKIGWAGEPDLQWQSYQEVLPACDLLVGGLVLAERARVLGWPEVLVAPMNGVEARFFAEKSEGDRDIDVLAVGNLHPAVQRERLPYLARLARLGPRYRVHIASGASAAEYEDLLRRAKLVVDLSRPGHVSRRLGEAAACGALVLAPEHCRDKLEGIGLAEAVAFWADENLEDTIDRVVAQARSVDHPCNRRKENLSCSFGEHLQEVMRILKDRPPVGGRSQPRETVLWRRAWQTLYAAARSAPELAAEVERCGHTKRSAAWMNLAALLAGRQEGERGGLRSAAARAIACLHQAAGWAQGNVLIQLNLAEALAQAGEIAAAAQQARHALRLLETPDAQIVAPGVAHYPARFDAFRVEWDRAGWRHYANSQAEAREKSNLLRWRLQALLSELTGIIVHAYEAVGARPDLPLTQAALGLQLARQGQPLEALAPLRRALALNPLDQVAAQALWRVLGVGGLTVEQERLAEDRRRLHQAAPRLVQPEPWFAPPLSGASPRAAGTRRTSSQEHAGLVSIVIPCCNGLADTKACVSSLLAHTRPAFELVFVDNGSEDATAEFVQQLRNDLGAERVRLHRNEANQGFPKACNQGAALAEGEFLLFLNNDTVVTPHWLEGLLQPLLAERQVGLVGPVSNHAPPPQFVAPEYQDLADLDRFAVAHARRHAGQIESIGRVSGFCLLVRRALFQELGGFDERFGLGFFDDDDLSRRVRRSGRTLAMAKEVYIHHHGGRTFQQLGLDRQSLLETNKERFAEKWGAEALRGYRAVLLPATPLGGATAHSVQSAEPAQPARRRVSLTMIVKNEERHLPDCLRSVRDLVDEIIINDTGSRDNTPAIAASFGAKVVRVPWADHFAAARNAALAPAAGDYVLWLDADDRLDEENRGKLKRLFAELGPPRDAYAFKVRSALDPQGRNVRLLDQVRLFPRHPQIRWEYRIHEQILPAVRRRGGEVRWTDMIVDHVGYVDPHIRGEKLKRNIRLLRLDEAERPFDSFTLFNLGWTLLDLGETEEAILRLRRSLDQATPDSSILRKIYVLLTQAHRQIRQWPRALELCRQGRLRCPDDLELPFEEALILRDRGDLVGAERCLLQLLAIPPQRYFASVDPELKSVRVKALLAELARRQGRWYDAVRYCREGLEAGPRFVPLWLEWAEVCLTTRQWQELEQVALGLAEKAQQPLEAEVVRARGERGREEFAAARARLERLLTAAPEALGPRLLLSHILLQEGADPKAAEQALLEVLKLDPQNHDALQRLRSLRQTIGHATSNSPTLGEST